MSEKTMPHASTSSRRRFVGGAVALALLLGGFFAARWLSVTAPKAERKPAPVHATLVETALLEPARRPVLVEAMGRVAPARETTIYPEVSGVVAKVHSRLRPGEVMKKGEVLLELDPADYRIVVEQRQADLAKARADYALEQGEQLVAQKDYEIMGLDLPEADRTLVLRQPQLHKAEASVQSAQAALARARLDLARVKIRAPFTGVVAEKSVSLGARVASTTPLARLLDAQVFWITAEVPVESLVWIPLADAEGKGGGLVRVRSPEGGEARTGRALRLLPTVDKASQTAQVLVGVERPFDEAGGDASIFIGQIVGLEFAGKEAEDAVSLDWRSLRDGDTVWLMGPDKRLEIRKVEVLHRGKDRVLVRGVRAGERLVTTNLNGVAAGMPLKDASAGEDSPTGGNKSP